MISRSTTWRILPLLSLLVACHGQSVAGYCTAAPSRALDLAITDSVSAEGVADSSTGTAATLTYADSLHHLPGLSDSTAWAGDQLGTYRVTIHRPGYADWVSARPIVVSQLGACGTVLPVHVSVRLVPVR